MDDQGLRTELEAMTPMRRLAEPILTVAGGLLAQ
jgi:hypothetical protein